MGGAVQSVAKTVGLAKASSPAPAPAPSSASVPTVKASRMDEEQAARMRGSRRRGRQLLSDARLNPESGTETLGGGQSLG